MDPYEVASARERIQRKYQIDYKSMTEDQIKDLLKQQQEENFKTMM